MGSQIMWVMAFAALGKAATTLVLVQSPELVYATDVSKGPGSVVAGLAVDSGGLVYLPGGGPAQGGPRWPVPALTITARVNGVTAPVLFGGQAPGLIAGAIQVNLRIPAGTPSGNANVVVSAGSYSSLPTGVTIVVKGN